MILVQRKLLFTLYFLENTIECHLKCPLFVQNYPTNAILSTIVETTMRFTTPDFAPSGAHNKMIENENFRCFSC